MEQETRKQRHATHAHPHWGRWLLLMVLLGLAGYGAVQWYHVDQQRKLTATPTTVKQTNRLIQRNAQVSQQQRHGQTTALDRTAGSANPDFTANLTKQLTAKKFSGTALVVKNDRVIYQKSFGWANAAKKQRNSPKTQYLINSLQKSMTGLLVMRAIEQGKLKMTDTLHQFYPQVKNSQRVTIRQMLNMEGGLLGDMKPDKDLGERQIYRYAAQHVRVDTAQLNHFNYQPICYVMLAAILNQVTDQSYYHQFYQQIVTPLNLNETSFVQLRQQNAALSLGYSGQMPGTYSDPETPAAKDVSSRLGTGNVAMSPSNVFKTVQAIVQGKRFKHTASAKTLLEPGVATPKYTGGMYHFADQGYYGHGVGNFYEDTFLVSTDGRTGVIFMSNNFYKKTMWPTWSTEDIAKATFKQVVAATTIQ